MPKEICPVCNHSISLRGDGTMYAHISDGKACTHNLSVFIGPKPKPVAPAMPEPKKPKPRVTYPKPDGAVGKRTERLSKTADLIDKILTPTEAEARHNAWVKRFKSSDSYKSRQEAAAESMAQREAEAKARKAAEEERRALRNEPPYKAPKPIDPKKLRITVVRGGSPGHGKRS